MSNVKKSIKLNTNIKPGKVIYSAGAVFHLPDAPEEILEEYEQNESFFDEVLDLRQSNINPTSFEDKQLEEMNFDELKQYVEKNKLKIRIYKKDTIESLLEKITTKETKLKEEEEAKLKKEEEAEVAEKAAESKLKELAAEKEIEKEKKAKAKLARS